MSYTEYITKKRKKVALFAMILAVLGVLVFNVSFNAMRAMAEEQTIRVWIMCQPGDWVHGRKAPSTRSESVARLETGDSIEIDDRSRNGFLHSPHMPCEYGEGWVYSGFLVTEPPQNAGGKLYTISANGRVACRKWVEGPRRCWVVDGSEVKVYSYTSAWAVTNKGFIQSTYIGGLIDE